MTKSHLFVPFVPSGWHKLGVMVDLANPLPGQKMADLGSGDGRIIMAFASKQIESHGYEIDPNLILQSEESIINDKLDDYAFIHPENFWDADLSQYDIITVFGMPTIMENLEQKLRKELKSNAKVLSMIFKFPTWEPALSKDNVHVYVQK